MRILLYADPWIIMQIPPFSCSWLDYFFVPLAKTLAPWLASGELELRFLGGNHHIDWLRSRQGPKMPDGVRLHCVDYSDCIRVFANGRQASSAWLRGTYTAGQTEAFERILGTELDGYEPDIVICFASPAPYWNRMFPRTLVLHAEAGLAARRPFHTTWTLDPCGVLSQSFLSRFAWRASAANVPQSASGFAARLHEHIAPAIAAANPFLPFIQRIRATGKFRHYVLLPLQVSGYFAFDACCPFESQFDFLIHVLENVREDTAVFVTEYVLPQEGSNALTPSVIDYCRRHYPNFVYSEEFSKYQAPSQYLYDQVDAVIAISSSVGLQSALLWRKLLCVLGDSHLTPIADCLSLQELAVLLEKGSPPRDRTDLADYLLTHYYIPEGLCTNTAWVYRFLERCLSRFRETLHVAENFFDAPLADPALLLRCHQSHTDEPLPRLLIPWRTERMSARWMRIARELAGFRRT